MKRSVKQRVIGLGVMTVICLLLVSKGVVLAAAPMVILVNKGPFAGVEQAAQGEEQVNWWDDNYSDDRACTECFAAVELAKFLPRCTNLKASDIKIQAAEKLPESGDVILIGSHSSNPLIAAQPAGEGIKLENGEAFNIRTTSADGRTITIIEGSDRQGALYGTYSYLEQLGIRFFGLGEQGTVYPDKSVELPKQLDITENPSFLTRGYWAWEDRGDEDFFLWMVRNRMNMWTAAEKEVPTLKKMGMKLTYGGHTIQESFLNAAAEYPYNYPKFQGDENKPADPYAPSDEYAGDTNGDGKLTFFEAHPDWFGLYKDKRTENTKIIGGVNYCTSNPDATHELVKNMVQAFIDGQGKYADIAKLNMLDVGKWCECENCKRQGTYTDRLFHIADAVLKEIQKAREEGRLKREVFLTASAYSETLPPPTRPLPEGFDYDHFYLFFAVIARCYAHPLADPACSEFNQDILKQYEGWAQGQGRYYTGQIFIVEYYNVSSFKSLPVVFPRIMAADIPWYYRTGARHLDYMHVPTRLWGTWTLNQYMLARLLWNTQTDSDKLLDEYFSRYYPTTSEHTRKFYEHLEKASANIKAMKHSAGPGRYRYSLRWVLADESKEMFPRDHFHYEEYHPLINDGPDMVEIIEAVRQAREELEESLLTCSNDIEKQRLLEDERRFSYGEEVYYYYYHLVRTSMFSRLGDEIQARDEFRKVEEQVEKLKKIVDLVQVSSKDANAEDGFDAARVRKEYEYFKKKYGN